MAGDIAKNTLLSVLEENSGEIMIGREYWDAVIWIIGAWYEYLYTGDKTFLETALRAGENSIKYFEETEFSKELNLFRGPACYGDGVSAYPDMYVGDGSGIIRFVTSYPDKLAETGIGIPMYTLSTNCLYYYLYVILDKMRKTLGKECAYKDKSEKMKNAVNRYFWNEEKGLYRYIADDFGGCDSAENLGQSFAVLFGIADREQSKKIMEKTYITPNGIPCVWPNFKRYDDNHGFGRHSGTIWPHIEGFFADAACKCGRTDIFENELLLMAKKAVRDGNFAEIYHPYTGEIYGGIQEHNNGGIREWESVLKQTWSASGFIRMIIFDLFGMEFSENEILINPANLASVKECRLDNIKWKDCILSVSVKRNGEKGFKINGKKYKQNIFKPSKDKEYLIEINI